MLKQSHLRETAGRSFLVELVAHHSHLVPAGKTSIDQHQNQHQLVLVYAGFSQQVCIQRVFLF